MADKKLKETVELRKGYQLALRQAPREQARGFREVRRRVNGVTDWSGAD